MDVSSATTRHEAVQRVKRGILDAMDLAGVRREIPADWLMEGLILVLQTLIVDQNHLLDEMWDEMKGKHDAN